MGAVWWCGVDRGRNRAALEAAGADVVVGDVEQLDLEALRAGPWRMIYEGFDPAHESHWEALTALGNGYLVTRGAAPACRADGVHYPGTYLAGVYNRLVSSVQGREVETEHLVNAPNWLPLDVGLGAGGSDTQSWWSSGAFTVAEERRELICDAACSSGGWSSSTAPVVDCTSGSGGWSRWPGRTSQCWRRP